MPSYAQFLKEILSHKRKLEEHEIVALTNECCVVIQNKLLAKLKGCKFAIAFCPFLDRKCLCHVLCDLGSNVYLMSLLVCQKFVKVGKS